MTQREAITEAKKRGLKWVAMDADGMWYGCKEEMSPLYNTWNVSGKKVYLGTNTRINWRESQAEAV